MSRNNHTCILIDITGHLLSTMLYYKYRLQSGKAQYIAKGGKVGRKTGYRKPKEKKAEQYSGILKLLSKNYPIKMVSKLEGVSVSTVQRLKKEFCL